MQLGMLDWAIIISSLSFTVLVGVWASKRASQNSESFFLASRNMPWWLLGTSMVATTFSADTPNLVTDIVRNQGVAGNWAWWSFLLTGMLTTFVYAKLWRRLGVTTDVEFYEFRYSGKPARFLRAFRAVYLGLFFNIMIMASVTLAAIKIGSVLFSVSPVMIVLVAGAIAVLFSAVGGFLGVIITDMMLFILAMAGSILAAWFSVNHPEVGGLDALLSNPNVVDKLSVLPDFSDPNQYIPLLIIPLAVQWWSVWYPGAEPGGGGYVAQRMLAAKDENHAMAASAFFNFCHYALRPWPWILVALASLVVFPTTASLAEAFPHLDSSLIQHDLAYSAMLSFLPVGVLGIVVASLISAYVSTISTSLNWGASYIVNDVYVRFINPEATGKQAVFMGRLVTVLLMVMASLMALKLESAMQAFRLLLNIGAGTGLLFIIRWFWFRVNAWSEIWAMILSFFFSILFEFGPFDDLESWQKLVFSVALTTQGWILATFLTRPTDKATLDNFANITGVHLGDLKEGLIATVLAVIGVYSVLFLIGSLLYGNLLIALGLAILAAGSLTLVYRRVRVKSASL